MSPDKADQPGVADPEGIHGPAGAGSGGAGNGDRAQPLQEQAGAHQISPVEGVRQREVSPGELRESVAEPGASNGSGGKDDAASAGMGSAASAIPQSVYPAVREGENGAVPQGHESGSSSEKGTGGQVPRTSNARTNITANDVKNALKATDAVLDIRRRIRIAAEAMRVSEARIKRIIDGDPELRAVYGTTGGSLEPRAPQAPSNEELMDREEDDLPPAVHGGTKAAVEIVQMVDAAERELHMKGLKALGVNESTLTKLRDLDGLASSTGAFIAIGLEKTHRLYYLAVVDLKTVADQIKERYLDKPDAVSNEERPFYYRNYIDAVKEFGRAYDLFIQGAAVILKIVGGNKDEPEKTKMKLGFTGRSPRKVAPANAQN